MKKLLFTLLLVGMVRFTGHAQDTSDLAEPPDGDNEKAEVSQWIGPVKITIDYHSPRVHLKGVDRTGHIWGELIPYGFNNDGYGGLAPRPWRAGANEATSITFSNDVKVGGKDLKAGTYGLLLDLEKTGPSNWIFSSNSTQWGSFFYEPKNDVLRVPTTPQDEAFTEFLTYGFDDRVPDSATAFVQWENKRFPFKIEVPGVNEIYVAKLRQQLESYPGFSYHGWQRAAQICVDHKFNLEEALTWADKAINEPYRGTGGGRKDFPTMETKAAVLYALGRDAEADAVMSEAVHLPGADVNPVRIFAMRLLKAGQKDKAMEIFKLNAQLHPEDKFFVNAGLARGYTALGDKENAIKSWETALQNVPDNQKANLPVYQKALDDLKK